MSWEGEHPDFERLQHIRLGYFARVHGSGNKEEVDREEMQLARPARLPMDLPFSFRLPHEGPATYPGRHVKVEWFVYLVLDLPWRRDPRAEWSFTVLPRQER